MKNPLNLHKIGPGGIVIQIDVSDPDTPALVWDSLRKRHSSTFDCAISEGELDCGAGPQLSEEQVEWLTQFEDRVADAYDFARKGNPEYS